MILTKDKWTKDDIEEFQKFLLSFSKGKEKSLWERRIANTSMPCIAVPSNIVSDIVRKISKGNFLTFINLWIFENLTNTLILGKLISKIKDFNIQKKYFLKFTKSVDSWASTDSVKLHITKLNQYNYLEFAKELIKSKYIYQRRFALIICLKLINDDCIDEVLKLANSIYSEKEYYVNMANAWLVCECFTKYKEKTLPLLEKKCLNQFTQNKAISKCRDSFRISIEDKEYLKTLRI